MEQFLLGLFSGTTGGLAYGLVFGILILCGLGLPVPEDVSLILGGFLVYQEKADLIVMMVTGYVGIIAGDSLVFFLGRKFGQRWANQPTGFFSRVFTPEKRQRVEELFNKHGEKIVFIARFLPGVRTLTFFTAGSVKMKYSHFSFFDSVAALISAPVFVYLGDRFGGELEFLIKAVRHGQTRVLLGLVVAIALYLLVKRALSQRQAKKQQVIAAVTDVTTSPSAENSALRSESKV